MPSWITRYYLKKHANAYNRISINSCDDALISSPAFDVGIVCPGEAVSICPRTNA
jgi:hypothetical protein